MTLGGVRAGSAATYRIAMVIPLRGPGGIFGPSCMAVSELAASELNAGDGIGGRRVELVYVDGGREPALVAAEVRGLLDAGLIDAVSGWHISSIRQELAPVVRDRIPYVYTSLYEGGENSPGVYCSGETPEQQILPAMRWLRDQVGVRRWYIVGADYVWPLHSHRSVERFARDLQVEIVGASFVSMGHADMARVVRTVANSGCDGALILLVGQDAVSFNREFAELALHERVTRFSPLMEENMLLAGGPGAGENLYSSASYFRSLVTASAIELVGNYVGRNGAHGPALNNMGESCYQGIYTLANLARRSRGVSIEGFDATIDGLTFESPRGQVRFHGNQAVQTIHLAKADQFDFAVIDTL